MVASFAILIKKKSKENNLRKITYRRSRDLYGSANDPRTKNDPQIGTQMILVRK